MYKLWCVVVMVCRSCGAWELRDMGIAVCGSLRGWGVVVGRLQGGGLQCGWVAVWAGCGVGGFWKGELQCGGVAVWEFCGAEELQCAGVVCRGELRVWGSCSVGSCGVEEMQCDGVATWESCSVWQL